MMNRPDDHEAKMARADLFKLAQYSFKLFKMIREDQELEGWVQAKITKSADYIASVYHYLQYEMKISEYGDHIENAEMYSESIRRVFAQKLDEAKARAEEFRNVMVAEEKSSTGGEITKFKGGLRHKHNPERFSDEPHGEPESHAKSKSAAEKKADKDADKAQEKAGKDWEKRFGKGSVTRHKMKETTMAPSDPDGATAPPPKGKDGKYPFVVSGPHKGKRWSPQTPGPTNPAMKEALKGGQKKLDVDKDGKLEKSDFAKLRASKKVKEAAKPDFLDMDKDGDKKEPMKKAVSDKKKVKEFASPADAGYDPETSYRIPAKAGKFGNPADWGKAIANKIKGPSDVEKSQKEIEDMYKRRDAKNSNTTLPSMYDLNTPEPTFRETMKKTNSDKNVREATSKCNHTPKGKKCPVHGLKECGGMYEGSTGDYSAKKAAAGKDIGKPGKNFAKIEKSAGGGEKGKKIAGAVLAKLRAKG